jgi:cysteine synthase A
MECRLEALTGDSQFIQVRDALRAYFYLKLEFLNPAGSSDFKRAIRLIGQCESTGLIRKNTILVDAPSGSLGVALAAICAERGYRFKCMVDPGASPYHIYSMKALGAEVTCVAETPSGQRAPDPRLEHIRALVSQDARHVWISQNGDQFVAQGELTAAAILERIPRLDYLFLGAGSAGMLGGCIRHLSRWSPDTKVVVVNKITLEGSKSWGVAGSSEGLASIGSRDTEDHRVICATVAVPEAAIVSSCRYLARSCGVLTGWSTGSAMAAVLSVRDKFRPGDVVVAIAPDAGGEYLDTIYDDEWVAANLGPDALLPELYTHTIQRCVSTWEA